MRSLRQQLSQLFRTPRDAAGFVLILAIAVIPPILMPAWDFRNMYRVSVLASDFGFDSQFFPPYPASWLVLPFALLPPLLGSVAWNLANAVGFLVALRYWRSDLLSFSLSFPFVWVCYAGQIEGLLAAGIVMAVAGNPLIAGLGITLLTFKPQIGLFAIVFVLINRRDWRLLIVPAAVYLLSFLRWGWWIPEWLDAVTRKSAIAVEPLNVSLFPLSLILLPLLLRYRKSLKIWLMVESLVMPYFPVYSLSPLFTVVTPPLWVNALIWALYLSALFIAYPITPGFLIALTMLIATLALQRKKPEGAAGG